MSQTITLPVSRVQSPASLILNLENDRVQSCTLEMDADQRRFADALVGCGHEYVHHVASRLAGAGSVSQQLASIAATEAALGVTPSEQTRIFRRLALYGELVQSHLLHLGYLVLPDLVGTDSLFSLAKTKKPQSLPFIAMHRLGSEIIRVVGGRPSHPQRLCPGGFTKLPGFQEIRSLRQRIRGKMPQAMEIARFLIRLKPQFPDFERPAPGLALTSQDDYALENGRITSTSGPSWPMEQWEQALNAGPQRVGALARFNLSSEHLGTRSAKAAQIMELTAPLANPFHTVLAQYAEAVMALEKTVALLDQLEETGIVDETPVPVTPKAGKAVAALEGARGLVIHEYEYDDQGRITQARIPQIPTTAQDDLNALVPLLAEEDEQARDNKLCLLARVALF